MAGGAKETPRQKMVGMMYLVLTALLALQVSNSVLDKFLFIDDSLQHAVRVAREDNEQILQGMEKNVKEKGNRPEDLAVIKHAKTVMTETNFLLSELERMRQGIIENSGGTDEQNKPKGAKSYDEVMTYMLGAGGSKSGEGYKLKAMLNGYAQKISELDEEIQIEPLAQDAWEMTEFKNNPDQKNKDFAQLNFDHTPTVAAMAVLSQMATEVVRVEAKALEILSTKVGIMDIEFDEIKAFVSPESKVVTAGTPYKARLLLTASSSTLTPKMSSSIGTVKVNGGVGEIEFTPNVSNFNAEGKAIQSWRGGITINHNGRDTTFTFEEEMTVLKPSIQIQAAAIQALYFNCSNKLNVLSPSLGGAYSPEFSTKGGLSKKLDNSGKVEIVPKSKKVLLTVKNNGATIGTQIFRVRPVPLPTIQILGDNQKLNQVQGGKIPRTLKVKIKPNSDFKQFLPKDARYKIVSAEVTLARGRKEVLSKKFASKSSQINQTSINISDLASKAKKGDRLVIQIKKINRLNFQNKTETVKLGQQIITYPITK